MKNISLFLLIPILTFLFNLSVQGQERDHFVPGELLIQIKPTTNPQDIVEDLQFLDGQPTQLKIKKIVSKPMHIWLLTFDYQSINQQKMRNAVHLHRNVSVTQFNHYIEMRTTIPNDPQYPQQWQYDNTGQSGGTIGADIDADSAWDISTGGLTALGDTIVVCVIDGGIDLNHNDLTPNRWINHGEIPNNNIDDDNNGYVDDYLGWSVLSGTDNISGNNHGTAVAGIIGAKGNNGIGVSGINWDVKLMIIKGGVTSQESDVIEAYTYPLIMRKKYNESNGAEGAFVVATNASWGLNNGQASSVPLWCAMYDTLGKYGILNVGAGPNANFNVDAVGDLPTTCPSEYLIGVTNVNHTDNKVTLAGYGSTHIDLGAFGEGTWTTANNGYSGFGGTSGATPHVTGSVALLYSTPCPSFAALAKGDPASAAAFAKNAILNSVDPNASLANITVTGGRLNLYKAMKIITDSCTGTCFPPFGAMVSNISDTSVTIDWSAITDTTTTFIIKYRMIGDTTWNIASDTSLNITLTGLVGCRSYEFSIGFYCDSTNIYSRIYQFETENCCIAPRNFTSVALSDTTVNLSWENIYAANQYIIRYKEFGTNNWTYDSTTTLPYLITDLTLCTNYEYQIQTVCDTGTTPFSPMNLFASGCANCTEISYCNSAGNGRLEFIDQITIDTFSSSTGNNDGQYTHTGLVLTLDKSIYPISITPGFVGAPFGENVRAWIDYNQDGDFDDPNENIFQSINSAITAHGYFTVPDSAIAGITRLRVALDYNALPTSCQTNMEGEVEDYCIEITNNILCDPPQIIDSSATKNSISLNWNNQSKDSIYIIRYRIENATSWTYLNSSTPNVQLPNLVPCTNYEVGIGVICNWNDSSIYSPTKIFNTWCISNTTVIKASTIGFNVYPNPFSDILNIEATFDQPQEVQIQLLSITGQVIQEHTFGQLSGKQRLTIPTGQIKNSGIYIIKMTTKQGIVLKRVMR